MARKEKVTKMEARIAPYNVLCVHVDGWGGPDAGMIQCGHMNAKIPNDQCSRINGQHCEHVNTFLEIKMVLIDAQGNEVSGDDDDSEAQTSI